MNPTEPSAPPPRESVLAGGSGDDTTTGWGPAGPPDRPGPRTLWGLRTKLLLTVLIATVGVQLVGYLFADPILEDRLVARAEREMRDVGGEVARAVGAGADPDRVADRLGARAGVRVEVLAPNGDTLGDTAGPATRRPPGPFAPPAGKEPELVVAVAADQGRQVRVTRPLAPIREVHHSLRELLGFGGLLSVLLAFVLTMVLSRTIVAPVQELTRIARALAGGDLGARSRSERGDEIGTLGRTLDLMAEQLRERMSAVRVEEARLRTVLDGMVEAVFVTDRAGRIVLHNQALSRLVDHPVKGRTAVEAIRSAELLEAVWSGLDGRPAEVDVDVTVGEGEHRNLAIQVAPLPERAGVVGVVHDVTELKRADRVRRDFVANASHELRTPLTAIRGYAETLREGGLGDAETASRFLETILKHTRRLQRLVDDLLALSRAESPDEPLPIASVALEPLAREVCRGLQGQADAKGIGLRVDFPASLPDVRGNAWALDQVLVNLVDNALKYSGEASRVDVRGRLEEDAVALEVEDNGPGIPGSELDRIFERFYRVEKGRSRQVGGTGLGLSIVRHLVQRMGADVQVDSAVNEGTVFRVRLPRADRTTGGARQSSPRTPGRPSATAS